MRAGWMIRRNMMKTFVVRNVRYLFVTAFILCILALSLPLCQTAQAADSDYAADISKGSVAVSGSTLTYYDSDGGYHSVTMTAANTLAITGATTQNTIAINAAVTVNITLSGVDINVSGTSGACAFALSGSSVVSLTLAEGTTNTLKSGLNCAGLQVPSGTAITISGSGTLYATGFVGAGIGGGSKSAGGSISITGGTIYADGSFYGAGIGGGMHGAGGTITITGGTVMPTSTEGAGIGGGGGYGNAYKGGGDGGTITITGGTVTATSTYGAGIGGGGNQEYATSGDGGTITITGGTVTATSTEGAGIGGGSAKTIAGAGGTVTISGGTVQATGGTYSAGIGGGGGKYVSGGTGGTISISSGIVCASCGSSATYDIGAGASGADDAASTSLVISGKAVVFVAKDTCTANTEYKVTHLHESGYDATTILPELTGWSSVGAYYPRSNSVTCDDNEGTGGTNATPYNFYETIIIADADGFFRSGYTFAEWNTEADGSGTSYDPGDTFTVNRGHNLIRHLGENRRFRHEHFRFGRCAARRQSIRAFRDR